MFVATGQNSAGFTYTYGGVAFSRDITAGAPNNGSSGVALETPATLAAGTGASAPFTFNSATPTVLTINETPATAGVTQVGDVVKLSGTDSGWTRHQ